MRKEATIGDKLNKINIFLKTKSKHRVLAFGRGDASRTRNRRFWRPLLYH